MKKGISGSDVWQLRVLFGLGIFALFAMLAFPAYLTIRALRHSSEMKQAGPLMADQIVDTEKKSDFLGEMGSSCGGAKRLPCKPGLICDAATDGFSQGSCVKDPKAPKGEAPMQFGEACGAGLPSCGPGLFCREDLQRNSLMFCSKLNESAPFIVSVKVEGMSPADGGYHAAVGTTVTFHVQTTNVDRVRLVMDGKILGEAKKSDGGKFDYSWKIPVGLDGAVEVMAYRGAEFSSVRLSVQADR